MRFGVEKTRILEFENMFTRFDRIRERDSHTNRRTPHGGIGRAYASGGKKGPF